MLGLVYLFLILLNKKKKVEIEPPDRKPPVVLRTQLTTLDRFDANQSADEILHYDVKDLGAHQCVRLCGKCFFFLTFLQFSF